MVNAYEAALHKGLPYPILTVAEYLAWNEEGFGWGRTYRYAGYFSSIALWYVIVENKRSRLFFFFVLFLSVFYCDWVHAIALLLIATLVSRSNVNYIS